MARSMPAQKPGESKQDYQTPPEFLDAVQRRFGPIRVDLAAHERNHVVPTYYGPGSPFGEDAFKADWSMHGGVLWLNPPFGNVEPFAKKCREDGARGARVTMLIPAAVGTDYFAQHIHRHALILGLSPRITFVGESDPFIKDLILCAYGPWVAPGFDVWRWKP
jgi:phage N-6-adenine-methyltransferase